MNGARGFVHPTLRGETAKDGARAVGGDGVKTWFGRFTVSIGAAGCMSDGVGGFRLCRLYGERRVLTEKRFAYHSPTVSLKAVAAKTCLTFRQWAQKGVTTPKVFHVSEQHLYFLS
jgi:hypothetical protein